jgi:pilus assembly protein CpaC
MNNNYRALLLGIALAFATPCAFAAHNVIQTSGVPSQEIHAGQGEDRIVVALDKSKLVHFDRAFREISVGSKDIAEVLPMSRTLIYVLGRKYGTTNLTLKGQDGDVVAVVDVVVTYDIDGLRQSLHNLVPDENIAVSADGDAISLSGQVSSADHLRQILAVADRYAPGKVTNMLSLGGSQQVLLEVKFAEVQRSAIRELGINSNLQFQAGGDTVTSAMTGVNLPATAYGALSGVFNHGNYSLTANLNALQKKGLVRTLAEPNLVALSGDTASFLAGGEFPIPVAQTVANGVPTITIDYKDFGVGLSFTPTIIGKELVNLVIKSEVSSLDPSLSVAANGFQIPALKVRRAKTTIELNDGQSFAIAGLLQDDFTNNTGQFPMLGDLPVLGALFRSVDYQHNQTDLVIIITAHLVQPTSGKNLSTPVDNLALPTPLEHLGNGDVEENPPKPPANNQGYVLP